jgi:TRAP-type C4-dicarboxylate transport system substrate-binding protein
MPEKHRNDGRTNETDRENSMRKLTILAVAAVSFGAVEANAQEVIRVGSFLPARSSTVVYGLLPFMERFNKAVGDEAKVQGYWGGSLGRNPRKQADLVKDGVADVAQLVPGYTPGQFPGFSVMELPFLIRNALEGSVTEWRLFKTGLLKGWEPYKVVGLFSTEPNHFHTKRPMKSVTDLDGMKVRIAGPVYGATVKHYGGIGVGMPVTQATEALSRGVVDGVLLGWGGGGVFRIYSIAKFTYAAPLGISPLAVIMNKEKWNSLSRRVQQALDENAGEAMARDGGSGFDKNAEKFRKIAQKGGHTTVQLTDEDIRKGFEFAKPLHREWIANNENGQAIYDAYLKIIDDYRKGG